MKRLTIILGIVIVLIVAVVFLVLSNINTLITQAVIKYGSEITRADVRLAETEIDAASGKGTLRGLVIGNPQGFKTPNLFKLDTISLTLDMDSLTQDPIVIREIAIDGPQATYELSSSGSNIDAIQKNVNHYLSEKGIGGGQPSPQKEKEKKRKLIIENFYVRNGKVNVSATLLKGQAISMPLPDIHLKDIGKDKGGVTPGEAAKLIFAALQKNMNKAVAPLGLDKLGKTAGKVVGEAGKIVGKGAGVAQDVAEKGVGTALDVVEKGAKGIEDTLGGLFGKK